MIASIKSFDSVNIVESLYFGQGHFDSKGVPPGKAGFEPSMQAIQLPFSEASMEGRKVPVCQPWRKDLSAGSDG
ncbi:hypothetical protein P40_12275 [Alloalcanivorax xenomutans]|nr:hypothetical protein P40_12275 [Alloalcanivorax xenomutans]